MKKTITLLVTILVIMKVNSQEVELDWAKQIGGTEYNLSYSITTDATGNIYTTGYFSGTTDFDPGIGTYNLTSFGSVDIFVSKIDASGNFMWAKQFGGSDGEFGLYLILDITGNIYLTGGFSGTVDFDSGVNTYNLTALGISDAFISKIDASGNFVWAKQFGRTGSNVMGSSLAVDASSNVYSTGYFSGTVDFDPEIGVYNLTSSGNDDIFISKLDSSGNFVWAKRIGGTDTDGGVDIKVDDSGSNIYYTGEFRGTVDFDPNGGVFNLTSSGSRDIYISKLDAAGNLVWAKKIGGSGADRGHSLAIDNANNYLYITGEYSGTTDFDPATEIFNLTAVGGQDCFITKFDMSGNFVWARSMGGPAQEEPGNSILLDSNGDVIVTGWFWGTSDFDPGINTFNLTAFGQSDVFIAKLDSEGDFSWAKNLGGAGEIYVSSWSSALDSSGNIYTTGNFEGGTVDFDPGTGAFNLTPFGGSDIFIHKMRANSLGTSENNFGENFKIYPNPTNGQVQIAFGDINNDFTVSIRNQLAQITPAKTLIYPDHLVINIEGAGGIYYVEIRGDNGESAHFKIFKK